MEKMKGGKRRDDNGCRGKVVVEPVDNDLDCRGRTPRRDHVFCVIRTNRNQDNVCGLRRINVWQVVLK